MKPRTVRPEDQRIDRLASSIAVARHRALHIRLTRGYEIALRRGVRAPVALREVIRDTVRLAEAAGHSRGAVRDEIMMYLSEHPVRDTLDRISVIDGMRVSDRLLERVERWIMDT